MMVAKKNYSGTRNIQPSKRELENGIQAKRMAVQGMVLLKNDGVLPLSVAAPIALLGGGAVKTVKGGTGSGDVNNRESISIYRGLKDAGAVLTSEDWMEDYEKLYQNSRLEWKKCVLEDVKHMDNPFDAYAANPFSLPEGRKITAEDVKDASAAVYVLSRIAGEGKDRKREAGDYYLSQKEREDLLFLNQIGIPIVLLLNVGAPVELTDILEEAENIRAVLHISLPGQEGGHAVADILFGFATPSGKLTATWSKRYEDYPFSPDFGAFGGNLDVEEYKEGIYVGYRYFDSFDIEPLFPFGYGLSYTDFSVKMEGMKRTETGVELTVSVKNTGETYAGKEVVQVYVTPPQTGMAKEYQRLAGFAKTDTLLPGEEQQLVVFIQEEQLASYSEQLHAWLVEAGEYGIWIGKSSRDLQLAGVLAVKEHTPVQWTNEIYSKTTVSGELGAAPSAEERAAKWQKTAEAQKLPKLQIVPGKLDKTEYQAPLEMEQSVEELIPLLCGNITKGTSMLGSAGVRVPGSAGETTEALEEKYNIPSLIMADGPAGLRLRQSYEVDRETGIVNGSGVLGSLENGFLEEDKENENADTYYQFCTAFPVGTALAQSWDENLLKEFGKIVSGEMKEFHINLWLAPGMNIQRNPLCGRNFEYFSEDPLLSGIMAGAVTEGVQSCKSCGVTIKHFACNNREDNRMSMDVHVSQRALREIYMRGFEIAIKKCMPAAIMTSYNMVNGVHAANSRELCTLIARKDWGFTGVIMSDWNTTVPEDGSVSWKCIAAGNDIIMPGNDRDDTDIRRAFEEGELSEEQIRTCAGRILNLIRRLTD